MVLITYAQSHTLNVHAKLPSGARHLVFDLIILILEERVCANSNGLARLSGCVWAMAGCLCDTVKLVLSGHLKNRQNKDLNDNGSLMKVESIAECCNTFDLY